jgi:hypothetical protein
VVPKKKLEEKGGALLHHVVTQLSCLYSGLMVQSGLRQLFRQGMLDGRKFGPLLRIPKAK